MLTLQVLVGSHAQRRAFRVLNGLSTSWVEFLKNVGLQSLPHKEILQLFKSCTNMSVHGMDTHVLPQLNGGTLKFSNGLEQMGVHGINTRVLTLLKGATLKFSNGLEQMGVHGINSRVLTQLEQATSICFNGL
jgi:hypothetical protein